MVAEHSWQRGRAMHGRAHRPRISAVLTAPALAGALAVIGVAESIARSAITGVSAQHALVLCAVALATTVPPAFATGQAAAVIVVAASVVSLTLFHTLTVAAVLAALIALHQAAYGGPARTRAEPIAVCLALAFLVLALIRPVPSGSEAGVLITLLAALAPAAAFAGVARGARLEAQRIDAARQAAAGDLLQHAARGERARIARELHDVVAHHISMIAVQAETARMTTPGLSAKGSRRLATIGDTARAALTEMRRLLGVLREDAETPTADLHPQPALVQLNDLLDQTRDASGSAARLILSGRPVTLGPGVELVAYRIVQEALTNARRHAPGAGVDVELHYGAEALRLRIRDTGPGPPVGPSAGAPAEPLATSHGLTGMRERAAAVGGRLHTGPAAGGGFLVEATLPVDEQRAVP